MSYDDFDFLDVELPKMDDGKIVVDGQVIDLNELPDIFNDV